MTDTDPAGRAPMRHLHDAVSHLQAGGIATACALSCAMFVPAPLSRILAVTFLVIGMVFYAVAPTRRP